MELQKNRILPNLRPRELKNSIPILLVLVPPALSAGIPETIERIFFVGFAPYGLFLPYLISFLILPFLFRQNTKTNRWLLIFGIFFLIFGFIGSLFGSFQISAIVYGFSIFASCAIASKIEWNENDVRILFWISTTVLVGLCLQVVLLSLGLISIQVDEGFATLGVEGEISRVSTTVGAATGSAVLIFLCGFLSFYSSLYLFRNFIFQIAILVLTGSALLLTFTRGGLLIFIVFVGCIFFVRSVGFRFSFGAKILLISSTFGLGFLLLSNRPDMVDVLINRGFGDYAESTALSDNGRFIRFQDAYQYWKDFPILGSGLGSYYHRKVWLTSFPGMSEGVTSPHNVYLLFLAEFGLVGFLPFIVFVTIPGWVAIRNRNFILFCALLAIYGIGMNLELIYFEGVWLNFMVVLWSMVFSFKRDSLIPISRFYRNPNQFSKSRSLPPP